MIKFIIIGGLNYGKKKEKVHKVQMTDGKRAIIQQLLEEYDIETAGDIQEALDRVTEKMDAYLT